MRAAAGRSHRLRSDGSLGPGDHISAWGRWPARGPPASGRGCIARGWQGRTSAAVAAARHRGGRRASGDDGAADVYLHEVMTFLTADPADGAPGHTGGSLPARASSHATRRRATRRQPSCGWGAFATSPTDVQEHSSGEVEAHPIERPRRAAAVTDELQRRGATTADRHVEDEQRLAPAEDLVALELA
jgi:hypothetical protein